MIKGTRLFPSVLHTASDQKLDGWEGVGKRLSLYSASDKDGVETPALGQKLLASDGVGMCENSTLVTLMHIVSLA